jgi:methylglutaconyl-CoA hydratase
MPDPVLLDITDRCATVTLNRPQARNTLSMDLIEALERAIEAVGREVANSAVRVVILAGAGEAFCAGMDLKEVTSEPAGLRQVLRGFSRVMRQVRLLPVPTIARVQGAAIGGGCGLMVVPDFTLTHPEAKLGFPEVSLGVCPAVVAPWLIRRIGPGRARAMLLEGRAFSGREGFDLGLVTHLAERAQVDRVATELAAHLTAGNAEALAITKRWLNELEGHLSDDLVQRGADLSADVLASPEAQSRLRNRIG